ncbi:phosphatidylserine/phosphatidylglycerophosphate/cardiolipin synthase family protein [Marinicella sp. W31]|uniref:phospholipase D-like domain-containing protein n=1 Tax=Marinicella sp. W31 TaxID=3023713 RepID=UPI0037563094
MKRILLAIALVILHGCQLSPEIKKAVDDVIEVKKDTSRTCAFDDPKRCAQDTPFYNRYLLSQEDQKNRLYLLEQGELSLLARLNLIRAAQQSIDIQTFIWVNDEAGNLVLRELLAAAKRGVRVRIIIDQLFSMGSSWFLAELAVLHENIEVQLFNPTFQQSHTSPFDFFSAMACCMARLNKRMHNKTFIVDGRYGITGGRNYQSRYYDWDASFNYRDRDVLAIGKVVTQMVSSFEDFWSSIYVVPLEHLNDVSQRILNDQETMSDWDLPQDPKQTQLLSKAQNAELIEDVFISGEIAVEKAEYFSDTPDKPFKRQQVEADELLTERIRDLISNAEHHILMQTPYLVFSPRARRVFDKLRKAKPDLLFEVSTNSLAATDAFYVYAISYKHKRFYLQRLNMHIYEYQDQPLTWKKQFSQTVADEVTKFGMHSKSFVIDNRISMIGSHNFDPRSDTLNTESGLIVESTVFAERLSAIIREDMQEGNSWVVAAKQQIPVLSCVSHVFATISRALPTLDIWPFRYSTSYVLRPGKRSVPPDHPDFYDNYDPIGNFPNVNLSSKQIQTIIISAFAGFAEPVM